MFRRQDNPIISTTRSSAAQSTVNQRITLNHLRQMEQVIQLIQLTDKHLTLTLA